MLHPALISQYQQYKTDSDTIARWMASTAFKLGYVIPPTAEVNENPGPKPRDGDTPRSTAREEKTSARRFETRKYVVATTGLMSLAAFIATSHGEESPVLIPEAFVRALDRVIFLQKANGDALFPEKVFHDENSDKRPLNFVGTFDNVQHILWPLLSSPQKVDIASLADRLAAVDIEGGPVFIEILGHNSLGSPTNYESATYELETTGVEAVFASTLMMMDLRMLRSTVKWIWGKYRDGHFQLVSASLATKLAMDLAEDLMAEVLPFWNEHETGDLTFIHFRALCRSKGVSETDLRTKDILDQLANDYDVYDIADETMFNARIFLEHITDRLKRGGLPLYNATAYDAASDWSKKSGRQKYYEDEDVLKEFFSELSIVCAKFDDYIVEENFVAAMCELLQTKKITLQMVFASQIYLDIHHEIRGKAVAGFTELFREIIGARVDLARHLDFHKDLEVERPRKQLDDRLRRDIQKRLGRILKDDIYEFKERELREKNLSVPDAMDRHRIFKRSPFVSGMMLHRTRTSMHIAGVAVANVWSSIMFACHLYYAYKSVRSRFARLWPDMELAESLLGTENFFAAGHPKTLNQFVTEFFLQMGVTAESMNRAKARGGFRIPRMCNIMATSDPAVLTRKNLVSHIFLDPGTQGGLTMSDIDRVMCLGKYTPNGSEDMSHGSEYTPDESSGAPEGSHDSPQGSRDAAEESRDTPQGPPNILDENTLDTAKINVSGDATEERPRQPMEPSTEWKRRPEELVKAMALTIQAEAVDLGFPYLHFHRICWDMLRKVHDACRVELLRACGHGYLEDDIDLPFVVGYIFMDAAGVYSGNPDPTMLLTAARVMDEELSKGMGNAMITVMKRDKGLKLGLP